MSLEQLEISCGIGKGTQQKNIFIDSRKVHDLFNLRPENYIFFAIKGERHDGHNYIEDLYNTGFREFVIEKNYHSKFKQLTDATFHLVEDVLSALQHIVAKHRSYFNIPVVGITGSNGKTIIKEWLSQLLEDKFALVKSPKSYNSQIGVPLSVWQLNAQHELAIFEAGISKKGEMRNLEQIIQPTIGIFTNIGTAHDEGFDSQASKIEEKLELFSNCQTLVYCKDATAINAQTEKLKCKKFTWGKDSAANLIINNIYKTSEASFLELNYKNQTHQLTIPFAYKASTENCMHCISLMLILQFSFDEINSQLKKLKQIPMRLELKEGINQCALIDDSYNNDYAGLEIAMDFLKQQSGNKSKSIILSDMLQSGLPKKELYQKVNVLLKTNGISKLIGIGKDIYEYQKLFHIERQLFYENIDSFINQHGQNKDFVNEIILIKGARKYGFEKITTLLQQKLHGTRLEINLNALTHNLNFYKTLLKPQTKIMVMVKAFAYGSGSQEVAGLLQHQKVDYLAVAYTDEAIALREKGIQLPIMVMNPAEETFGSLIENNVEPEIYSTSLLKKFIQYLQFIKYNQTVKIHIKFDTGMNRLGFKHNDFEELITIIKSYKQLKIASVFTHLSSSDEEIHNDFSLKQIKEFKELSEKLEKAIGYSTIKHCLNSPGITRFSDFQMDMVRLGIGLYGVDTNNFHQGKLQMISSLKTSISQIKHVTKGQSIGYGRKGKAEENKTIATIAIGYADGYDRRFSNGKGQVAIKGELVPVIGNVCMDMCMVDITGKEDIHEGDEVIVFSEKPSIIDLATSIGTIPYEILTNVNSRVKRVFYLD